MPLLRNATLVAASLAIVSSALWWGVQKIEGRQVAPSGGAFFSETKIIPVQHFRQSDERWRNDLLGATEETLAEAGCAVSSAAMVLAYYGAKTDTQTLNRSLATRGGYTERGWIDWDKAAEVSGAQATKIYEGPPFHFLMDICLWRGVPHIVRLRFPGTGQTHFVVVVGKRGHDYIVLDPGRGSSKGLYPLAEFGSNIEALRIYTGSKNNIICP